MSPVKYSAARSPFIRAFTLAIIKTIQDKTISHEPKVVIHADLVPRVSRRVMQASMKERSIMPQKLIPSILPPAKPVPLVRPPVVVPRKKPVLPPIRVAPPIQATRVMVPPTGVMGTGLTQDYGRITPLLNDPSVSSIECPGPGKPVTIIRSGMRQFTKIVLTPEEIKGILDKVSDAAHIPLLEGVFRAAVDNFSINAILSEMIGSRFVIKKSTPYAMLEGGAGVR